MNFNAQLNTYDGLASPKEFVRLFQLQASMADWDEDKQKLLLPLSLKGRALRIYEDKCKAKTTIKEQLEELVKACQPPQDVLLSKFFSISRGQGESISKFARRLQDSLVLAMPNLGAAEQAQLLRGQLGRAIPQHLRCLVHFNASCTWDELVDKLDKSLIELDGDDTSDVTYMGGYSSSPLIKKEPVEANWSQAAAGQGQSGRQQGKRFDGNCYKCNKPGHRAVDCRSSGFGGGNGGGNSGGANNRSGGNFGSNRSGRNSNDPRRNSNNSFANNNNNGQNRGKSNQANANAITAQQEFSEFPFYGYGEVDLVHIDLKHQAKLLKVPLVIKLYDADPLKITALVDSGSSLSFISPSVLSEVLKRKIDADTKVQRSRIVVNGATGSTEAASCRVNAKVQVGETPRCWSGRQNFLISAGVTRFDAILGRDFLEAQKAKVDHGTCSMEIGKTAISLNSISTSPPSDKPDVDDRVTKLEAEILASNAKFEALFALMQLQLAPKTPDSESTQTAKATPDEFEKSSNTEQH